MTTCRTSTTTGSRTDPSVPAGKERDRFRAVPLLFCPCAPGACRALISMGMPVSVLKEEKIFERVIAIRYDVPNDRPDMFDGYKKQIDDFYNSVMERNA